MYTNRIFASSKNVYLLQKRKKKESEKIKITASLQKKYICM